jgi:hypothetical protein
MRMKGTCALCKTDAELEASHVLPRFIFKWIAKTSATGRLRGLGNPNVPVQDGKKMYLLCSFCEDKFSKYETWFANHMFYPAIKGEAKCFEYNDNLSKFALSLFWRAIVVNMDRGVYSETPLKFDLLKCEQNLRSYLVEGNNSVYGHDMYIFPTSYVENAPSALQGLNFYFTRTTDIQIIFNDKDDKMFFYCVLPFFIIIGNVVGLRDDNFLNCKIGENKGGVIPSEIVLDDEDVTGFMQRQIKQINSFAISEAQQKSLNNRILSDMDRFMKSKSFEATFMDYLRRSGK